MVTRASWPLELSKLEAAFIILKKFRFALCKLKKLDRKTFKVVCLEARSEREGKQWLEQA